eukprot:TRINITY_DN17427_c0_g1_i1.p1 TRINITY_DN17427_c0_g1~~TRINITY_DN17427_c0_g1_i1.p1  ORF type:complete len:325 (+),score=75.36 TRINITY_DN17427_c0_g1_i1:285-1259(+)
MPREKSRSPEKVKKTSVTVKKVSTIERKVNGAGTTSSSPDKKRKMTDMLARKGFRITLFLILLSMIVVLSTVNLVISAIFLGSFKLHLLTMASNIFMGAPILMVIASSLAIVFCIFCTSVMFKTEPKIYKMFGMVTIIIFIIQFIAVVLAFLLRAGIENDLNKVNVPAQLEEAKNSSSVMDTWDTLQTGYKCCGGRGNSGYKEWDPFLDYYPDSCCTVYFPTCGVQAVTEYLDSASIYERIHVRGCITVIREDLKQYVTPMSLVYAVLGLIVCVCLLLLCAVCMVCANHLLNGTVGTRKRLTSTGRMEIEPLKYTSTLNVNLHQ